MSLTTETHFASKWVATASPSLSENPELNSFPAILLIATMLRLALNLASTRLILADGHTGTAANGRVIESFGNFVVAGNYVIGMIVFGILVIVNFVVITKSAGSNTLH